MSMQKNIIDRIWENGNDFLIELKANQPSLRYGVEDRLKEHTSVYSHTEKPKLGHGKIEPRTYRVFNDLDIIADKEKWGGNTTIIAYESETVKKISSVHTSEKRLYVNSLPLSTLRRWVFIGAQPLVDRKHTLVAGFQSTARQDKMQIGKSRPQSWLHIKNSPLGILNMERAP